MQEIWVWSLGREDHLEKEMATHSSILAWRIPWTEEPGRHQFMGFQRVRHNAVTKPPPQPKCNLIVSVLSPIGPGWWKLSVIPFRILSYTFPWVLHLKTGSLECKSFRQQGSGFQYHVFLMAFTGLSLVPCFLVVRLNWSQLHSHSSLSTRPLQNPQDSQLPTTHMAFCSSKACRCEVGSVNCKLSMLWFPCL